jgi:hypothetical protein
MTLNLVVDNSGSMIEGGRRFIERTVVRQFGRYLRTGKISAEVRLYLLSDNLVETAWKPDEDVPAALLSPSGHLNVETLMSAPSLMEGKTVLISDSCLSTEEDQKLQEWMARQTTEKVVVVRIGEDALTSRVAEGVFAVEQIEGLLSVL